MSSNAGSRAAAVLLDMDRLAREQWHDLCRRAAPHAAQAGEEPADAVQDALVRALVRPEKFANYEHLAGWTVIAAREGSRRRARSRQRERALAEAGLPDLVALVWPDDPALTLIEREDQRRHRQRVRRVLAGMPGRQRYALTAFHVAERSREEIASDLRISPNAVSKLLARARANFEQGYQALGCVLVLPVVVRAVRRWLGRQTWWPMVSATTAIASFTALTLTVAVNGPSITPVAKPKPGDPSGRRREGQGVPTAAPPAAGTRSKAPPPLGGSGGSATERRPRLPVALPPLPTPSPTEVPVPKGCVGTGSPTACKAGSTLYLEPWGPGGPHYTQEIVRCPEQENPVVGCQEEGEPDGGYLAERDPSPSPSPSPSGGEPSSEGTGR